MARKKTVKKSQMLLGKNIERLRLIKKMSRKQVGKIIRKNEQQIEKYENGDFVPLPVLEDIASALGEPIAKRIIRRISFLRKLEIEKKEEQVGLSAFYNEAFPKDIDE